VKLNLAAVLKESQLYKKQEDEVRRRLLDFEGGGKDAHEFIQWQQSMHKQDYDEQINSIERKRLDGKMSYEEAILARQRLTDENRRLADEFKAQTREVIEIHVKEKVKEEQRLK
jgi:LAS superfamily LD-carboxypeptidase LdcB